MTYTSDEWGNVIKDDVGLYALTFGNLGTDGDMWKAKSVNRAERIVACLEYCKHWTIEQIAEMSKHPQSYLDWKLKGTKHD